MASAIGKLNFSTILKRFGKSIVEELTRNIQTQTDINGNGFIPSQGTLKGRTVKVDGGTHQRLIVTGKFQKNAFKFRVTDTSVIVYVNESHHSKGRSYSDVAYYNNKGTSDNQKSPLIFPTADVEVEKLKSIQEMRNEVDAEVTKYFEQFNRSIATKVVIGK